MLPEAKTEVAWIDADRLYVGTDFGPGSMTKSSYPRIAKEWKRGTPLAAATTVFEGKRRRPRGCAPRAISRPASSATS